VTSTDRAEQLEHERHFAEILAVRKGPGSSPSQLEKWLNSSVVTTLIGVIGTAVVGTLISAQIQNRARINELARAASAARAENQRAIINKVLDRVSTFVATTDDVLVGVNLSYEERGRTREEIKQLRTWKTELATARDKAESEWRRGKRSLGLALHYEFEGSAEIMKAWQDLAIAIDAFEKCTNSWYTANAAIGTTLTPDRICPDERAAADQASELFVLKSRFVPESATKPASKS
jgi:hypothetical protein